MGDLDCNFGATACVEVASEQSCRDLRHGNLSMPWASAGRRRQAYRRSPYGTCGTLSRPRSHGRPSVKRTFSRDRKERGATWCCYGRTHSRNHVGQTGPNEGFRGNRCIVWTFAQTEHGASYAPDLAACGSRCRPQIDASQSAGSVCPRGQSPLDPATPWSSDRLRSPAASLLDSAMPSVPQTALGEHPRGTLCSSIGGSERARRRSQPSAYDTRCRAQPCARR